MSKEDMENKTAEEQEVDNGATEATVDQDENNTEENNTAEKATEEETEAPEAEVDPIAEAQAAAAAANDKYLRLYSEFDNFRKRTAREKLDIVKNAGSDLLKEVLPLVDDFDRAIKANETAEDIEAVKEGFNMIRQKVMQLLDRQGVKTNGSNWQRF